MHTKRAAPPHDGWLRLFALLGSLAVILVAFLLFVRPWYLQWGASNEEASRPMPGDAIAGPSVEQETRAITIHAGVEQVWPWLAQLGQNRGGFYSFDLLENLIGCQMPTEDRLRPDRQVWQLGDSLWMYPAQRAQGAGFATLREYVPGRLLVFGTHAGSAAAPEDGSWALMLVPIDTAATRLLARGRGPVFHSLLGMAFDHAIFEPMHFAMERRMMIGLKQLSEGGTRHRGLNHVHVVLWVLTFGMFVTAIPLVFRRRDWLPPLAGVVAAATVFQVLTLVQPPVPIGIALIVAVGAILWWPGFTARSRTDAQGSRGAA